MSAGVRLLVALALGVAAYLVTEQLVLGVGVVALGFWLLPQNRRRSPSYADTPPSPPPSPRSEPADGIAVVCKQVTPLRQEWVSVKTGRLYDVLSRSGVQDAQPGDHGQVVVEGSGYRILRSSKPD